MKSGFTFLIFFILIQPCIILAQSNNNQNNHIIEDAIENSAEQINESGQFEIPDDLMDLLINPIDINKNNVDIFVRYNLINRTHQEKLKEYKINMGNLVELEELQQVDGFNKKIIQSIKPYITVKSVKKTPDSHQLTFRIQKSTSEKDEFYSGSASKILFRYRANILSSVSISFTGEKDAGEEILTNNKQGFDFNSFNISYKGSSFLKKAILGDYTIECGQGLTAWTGFGFGNGSSVTGIYKYGRGIMPYSGTDENRFLRGVAVSLQKNKFRADFWVSYHKIDGNVVFDSTINEEYVSSLQTSGYHRTFSENLDHHSLKETFSGTSITYSSKNLLTGLVITSQGFSLPIVPDNNSYSVYKFRGKSDFNAGWNYSLTIKNFVFFGENVYNVNNSFAFLNGVITSLDSRTSLGFLTRYYSKEFPALKSNAFGVGSENTNESGNYIGILYKVLRSLNYSGYVDVYSFPFLKYRVDKPSHGFDFFHQLEFTPAKKFTSVFRYRKKMKEMNDNIIPNELFQVSEFVYENFRFSARVNLDNTWEYGFRTELLNEYRNETKAGSGTMVSQDLFFHPMGKPFSFNFRYAIFNCPQFNTRIYEYENDVQGAFSIPFYYGNGSRFYTNMSYKLNSTFSVSIRYSITWTETLTLTTEASEFKIQLKAGFR